MVLSLLGSLSNGTIGQIGERIILFTVHNLALPKVNSWTGYLAPRTTMHALATMGTKSPVSEMARDERDVPLAPAYRASLSV